MAALALAVSVWSAWEDRDHKRMSVRPHLMIEFFYDEADPNWPRTGWRLTSEGLGPAVVRRFEVYLDKQPQTSWETMATTMGLPDLQTLKHNIGNMIFDEAVAPSGSKILFTVSDAKAREIVASYGRRVQLELCYCSLYDECWHVTSFKASRRSVKRCELPKPGERTWQWNKTGR